MQWNENDRWCAKMFSFNRSSKTQAKLKFYMNGRPVGRLSYSFIIHVKRNDSKSIHLFRFKNQLKIGSNWRFELNRFGSNRVWIELRVLTSLIHIESIFSWNYLEFFWVVRFSLVQYNFQDGDKKKIFFIFDLLKPTENYRINNSCVIYKR